MFRALPFRPTLSKILLSGCLLAVLALLVLADAGTADAQSLTTLVSNTGQTQDSGFILSSEDVAQEFTTGANTSGYLLTSVGLRFGSIGNGTVSYSVSIYSSFSNGIPGDIAGTLTAPDSLTAFSVNTWTHSGLYLRPNRNYTVFINGSASSQGDQVRATQSNNEDAGGAAGLSLNDASRTRDHDNPAWQTDSHEVMLQIGGYVLGDPSPPTTPLVNSDPASPTTLSASWRPPDTPAVYGITSYDVRYRATGAVDWTDGPQDVTTASTVITGLTEGTAYEVQVRGTNVWGDSTYSASGYGTPGAQTSRVAVGNTGQTNEFTDNGNLSTHDIFQPFTTGGGGIDGYTITSVELLFLDVIGEGTTPPNVGIYLDRGSGRPGDQVGSLFTRPAGLVEGNDGVNTWTSPGIELQPNTTYLLGVISAGADPHIVRNSSVGTEDGGGLAGWSIGDSHNRRVRGGSSYSPVSKALKMRLSGHVVAGAPDPTTTPLVNSDPASPTTLSASWRPPDAPPGYAIMSYDVQYRVQGSTGAWSSGPQDVTSASATITGLTEGTAYEVQVRATNSEGDSAWSASGYGMPGAEAWGFVVGNTGQANEQTDNGNLSTHDIFQPFTTGAGVDSYTITAIDLLFLDVAGDGTTVPNVRIFTDLNGRPDAGVAWFTKPARLVEANDGVNTWTSPGIELQPGTTYHLGVIGAGTAAHIVRNSSATAEDGGGLPGWSVGDSHNRQVRGDPSYNSVSKSLKMRFWGTAALSPLVPPSNKLVGNTGLGHQADRTLGTYDVAQTFTTGPSTRGYIVTSVGIELSAIRDYSVPYTVSIYTDNGSGRPNRLISTITRPPLSCGTHWCYEISDDRNDYPTPEIYLAPNTTYLLLFDSSSSADNKISHTTNNNNDTGSAAGWSIGDDSIHRNRNGTGAWTTFDAPMRINIQGYALSGGASSPPTTPRVNSDPASPTTLSVSWRLPDTAVNVPVQSYDVRYRVQGSTGHWSSGPQDRTTTSATITGLTNGTTYEVQVRATDNVGDSGWSASGYGTAGGRASGIIISNTGQANEFTDNTNLSQHDVFHPFRSGSSRLGYTITSVDILFLSVAGKGATVPHVGIYTDLDDTGRPGTFIGYFTRPSRLVAANDGLTTYTSPGIQLQPTPTICSRSRAPGTPRTSCATPPDPASTRAPWPGGRSTSVTRSALVARPPTPRSSSR